ncbi:MAG TPA: Spy/CpxP family protein refolding chaperone [Hyphomicrobium sp.]|nr:Spy/CpxP family protein refolding chaperone [Hyphomicrobium sp.]
MKRILQRILFALPLVMAEPASLAWSQQQPYGQPNDMQGHGMMGMEMGGMGLAGSYSPNHFMMMHGGWFGPGSMGCFIMDGTENAFATLEQRLEFIRSMLAITESQRPQWEAFAGAILRSRETMRSAYQVMMNNMMNMNFADRFNQQLTAMNAHLTQLQQVAPALNALYGVMTNEQRQKADNLFRSMGCFV